MCLRWRNRDGNVQLSDDKRNIGAIEVSLRQSRGGPESWNPPYCGELDMRIAADGTWFYLGTPIGRRPLVKLFSSVLRREVDDRYYLVTPVEKIGIRVDDAPLFAVEMVVEGEGRDQMLRFRTLTEDWVEVGPDHRLRFESEGEGVLRPYVHVRHRLEALIARAVYYDLVALGSEVEIDGVAMFGVWSSGQFFAMAQAVEIPATL